MHSNIPAAGLACHLRKNGGIIRKAGILERRDYFFNALKSSLRIPFQQNKALKMIVAN